MKKIVKRMLKSIIYVMMALPLVLYGQKIGVNTGSPQTTLDVNGSLALREAPPLSILSLLSDDLTMGTYSVYRIVDATANFTISGIAGGQDGRIIMFINGTSYNMNIAHQGITSMAANRIVTNTNTPIILLPNGIITLLYSSSSQRWLVSSITGAIDNAYNAWDLIGNNNTTAGTNFIGTTNAQDLVFKTNNTEGVRLSSAGNLGVGSTNPNNKLTVTGNASVSNHLAVGANSAINNGSLIQSGSTFNNVISVQEEMTGNQTTNYSEGILSHLSINATNNPTTEFYALDAIAEVKTGNTQNYTSVVGNYHAANHSGTGTVSRLYGISSYAQNKAAGIVSDLRGFHIYPANNSTGTVTNSYGVFTKGINNIGAGTVTNAYGVFIDASCNTGGGVLTNNYGLYVEDHSTAGTAHFNVYSKGLSSKNYFQGYVGIGTTTPAFKLQIEEPGGYDGDIGVRLYNNNNIAYLPSLILQASKGTKSTPATLTSGYPMGAIYFGGYDGSGFVDVEGVSVTARTTQDWTSTAHGSKLEFYTIPNASTTHTQRMIIDQNGYVGIGVSGNPNQQLEITEAFRMPATTSSTTGVLYKDGNRFMHNYKPSANDGKNTFLGINAGNFTMSSGTSWLASGNTGVGNAALTALTSGGFNTALGNETLDANTTGSYNTAIGNSALSANISADGNTAVGNYALTVSTGSSNTAVGNGALASNTSASINTAVGESSLNKNTLGIGNTAIGQSSLLDNIDGDYNTAMGLSALQSNQSGNYNTAVGTSALTLATTASYNTAIGYDALSAAMSSNNVAIGYLAGAGTNSGSNNTFIGYNTAITNTTGSNITLIGHQANVTANNYNNSSGFGNAVSVTASNQVRLGNNAVTSIGGFANWSNISDRRFKKNVKEDVAGLDFILKLRPVTYNLDFSDYEKIIGVRMIDTIGVSDKETIIQSGFIAQEVEQTATTLGYDFSGIDKPKNEKDHYGLRYAEFVVPLVKAVQEQQKQIEALKIENEILKTKNKEFDDLKASVEQMQKMLLNQQKEMTKLNRKVEGDTITTNH